MTPTASAPIHLLLAHTAITSDEVLSQLSAGELMTRIQDGRYILLPSGEDVLAILANATRYDWNMIETRLRSDSDAPRTHPLEGLTLLIEAPYLAADTLPLLQQMNGKDRILTMSTLLSIGRDKKRPYLSQRMIEQAMRGNILLDEPEPVLEAASLLPPLVQMAETAVAHRHSLILCYTHPPPPPLPDTHFHRHGFLQVQLRPLLAAVLFALAFVTFNLFRTNINHDNIQAVLISNLINLILLPFSFLLPLGVAQTAVWLYARRHQIHIQFMPGSEVARVGEKERIRPFFLIPTPRPFTLMAFYQPPPHTAKALPNPTLIYFLCFALGIIPLISIFTLADSLLPLTHLFMASWVSALFFGLVHLDAERRTSY